MPLNIRSEEINRLAEKVAVLAKVSKTEAVRIALVPLSEPETREAPSACARYGKGQSHPAELDLGDRFSYACARTHGVPLLFIGNGFSQTDIQSALS